MKCSNCGESAAREALTVKKGSMVLASICKKCQTNVTVAKIVLRRNDGTESFGYDSYLPVELAKGS